MKVAIIPARGNSQRIPRKNIRIFHGQPIITYSIKAALSANIFDAVYVSTEDAEIAEVSRAYGAQIIERPAELADSETGTQAVTRHALLTLDGIEEACCIYATAPLMSIADLQRGHYLMHSSRAVPYAYSVGTAPLQDAGQFYWGRSDAFLAEVPLDDPHTVMVPISSDRVCDINTEEDWLRCEAMYLALRGRG